MVGDLEDPRRTEPDYLLGDRPMLEAWLEFHRTTLLMKCEGLDDAARKSRPVASSLLSLHGLLRHMAEVERNWFRRVLLRQPDTPSIWVRPGHRGQRARPPGRCRLGRRRGGWEAECEASRAAAASTSSRTPVSARGTVSLRWIYVHMIEEYARHNGHADLIREMVDGQVGW